MTFKVFFSISGTLHLLLALLLLPPLIWCWDQQLGKHFIFTSIATALIGIVFRRIGKGAPKILMPRDALAIVAYSWFALSMVGALPYWQSHAIPSFADAWFESVSGFTTTGSTILSDIESLPQGLHFWRTLTHWIGGLGVVVLFVSVFPALGVGGKNLFKMEVPGPITESVTPKIKDTSRNLWYTYLLLTAVEALLLWFSGMSWFDALTHSFATMATGGFSTKNASIAHFNSPTIEWIIIVFMFLAGANFGLYYMLTKKQWRSVLKDAELRFYAILTLLASGFIALMLFLEKGYDVHRAIRSAIFQVIALITTTGFASDDFELYPVATHLVLFFLLFTGGCAGSTAGGIKLFRIVLIGKTLFHELELSFRPSLVSKIRVGNTIISNDLIRTVLAFVGVYFAFITFGALCLGLEGHDMLTSMTAAMTAVGNVGPGFGTIGPTENFAHFSSPAKILLAFLMLLGRLEFFTLLGLLHWKFWKR
ncbi:MAG: TrkH family potassium uptake protein [SAR324 cluster bacterium]|nr:TrkH family potassium uptake protein [SAR324 cluster bacterium]